MSGDNLMQKAIVGAALTLAATGIISGISSYATVTSRVSAIEARVEMSNTSRTQERAETNARLDRIESKIDKLAERSR